MLRLYVNQNGGQTVESHWACVVTYHGYTVRSFKLTYGLWSLCDNPLPLATPGDKGGGIVGLCGGMGFDFSYDSRRFCAPGK